MTDRKYWVLDTNVLVSRLLAPRGVAAQAVDLALSAGLLLLSAATLTELVQVLHRPKFDPYVSLEERRRFISLLGGVARMVSVAHPLAVCRDPKDDKFLDIALSGSADAIITGDRDLLVLNPFHGVRILTPAAFLEQTTQPSDY